MREVEAYALVGGLIAAIVSYMLTERWIHAASDLGFKAPDMNKPGNVEAVRAGGIWSIIGIAFGLLVIVMLNTYWSRSCIDNEAYLALALQLVLAAFLGLIDDLFGWRRGLRAVYRVVLMAPLSMPIIVIKAGVSTVDLPLIGKVDLGLLYPLLLVPVGILGAANAFNMIAGYNGLEAGMGALLLGYATLYASLKGICSAVPAGLVGAVALLGFLPFNIYPAKTFPGNAFTYGIGAYYASIVVLGNFEKFGVTLFILYFLEFALFIRGKLRGVYKQNFGVPRADGTLAPPYGGRIYSVTHLALNILNRLTGGRAREPQVVFLILMLQSAIGALTLIIYL